MSFYVQISLTPAELAEATTAAWAYMTETRSYLRSAERFTSGHDDCCETAKARTAALAEQKRGLEHREATLVTLIEKLEAQR